MSKKIVLAIAAPSILLGVLAAVLVGPFFSLHSIHQALQKNDSDALAYYIDFESVQGSLKQQLKEQAQKAFGLDFGQQNDNPFSSFFSGFADTMLDTLVENAVTPTGLSAILSGKNLNDLVLDTMRAQPRPSVNDSESEVETDFDISFSDSFTELTSSKYDFEYRSHREFVFYLSKSKRDDVEVASDEVRRLIFIRDGLLWRLSEVKI